MVPNRAEKRGPAQRIAHRSLLVWLSCGSTCIVVVHWIILRFSDATWWGTVAAFAPRWPVGVPLLLLLPLTLLFRRWWLVLMNVVSAAVVLVPVMELEINGFWKECPSQGGLNLRILTCNVHGDAFDVSKLNAVIAQNSPDIVALQECPATIIQDCFSEDDWFTEQSGELCVASHFPIRSATTLDRRSLGGWGNFALSCQIAAPQGGINVVSVHFLSLRHGLEALRYDRFKAITWAQSEFQSRHEESKLLYRALRGVRDPTIIAGDFNMTPESQIFRKYLHNYADAFTEAGTGFGYTFPMRWHGVRIDHVLADANWTVKCCRVCDDVGSDHLPVVAELQRVVSPVDGKQ